MEENRLVLLLILVGSLGLAAFFFWRKDYPAGAFVAIFSAWVLYLLCTTPQPAPVLKGVNKPEYKSVAPVTKVYRLADVEVTPAEGVADPISLVNYPDLLTDPEEPGLEKVSRMYMGGRITLKPDKDQSYTIDSIKQTTRVSEPMFEVVERRQVVTNPQQLDDEQRKDKVTYYVNLLIPFKNSLTSASKEAT